MENINLIKLLSQKNYIMYNKEIAHKIGIESAILLGAMCSYCNSFKNEESIPKAISSGIILFSGKIKSTSNL